MAKKITVTTAIPDQVLAGKMSSPAKVLLAVLIQDARKTDNKIVLTNSDLVKASGIVVRTVTAALNELKEEKLIKETVAKESKKRVLSVDKTTLNAVNSAIPL